MPHPSPEALGPPHLKIDGFQIWIHGREFPDAQDYDDGNWLRVSAHCGHAGASVWTTGAIIQVMDFVRWAKDCEAVERGSRNSASLTSHEPYLGVQIKGIDSLGHLTMIVHITPDNLRQEHRFTFEIDQSYLRNIVKQCQEIAKEYPVKRGV